MRLLVGTGIRAVEQALLLDRQYLGFDELIEPRRKRSSPLALVCRIWQGTQYMIDALTRAYELDESCSTRWAAIRRSLDPRDTWMRLYRHGWDVLNITPTRAYRLLRT